MQDRLIIVFRGVQNQDKVHYAKTWCNVDPEHRIRISNDDIRNMFGTFLNRETDVEETSNIMLSHCMNKGYDIILDNTNTDPRIFERIEAKAEDFNNNCSYDWKYKVRLLEFPIEEMF